MSSNAPSWSTTTNQNSSPRRTNQNVGSNGQYNAAAAGMWWPNAQQLNPNGLVYYPQSLSNGAFNASYDKIYTDIQAMRHSLPYHPPPHYLYPSQSSQQPHPQQSYPIPSSSQLSSTPQQIVPPPPPPPPPQNPRPQEHPPSQIPLREEQRPTSTVPQSTVPSTQPQARAPVPETPPVSNAPPSQPSTTTQASGLTITPTVAPTPGPSSVLQEPAPSNQATPHASEPSQTPVPTEVQQQQLQQSSVEPSTPVVQTATHTKRGRGRPRKQPPSEPKPSGYTRIIKRPNKDPVQIMESDKRPPTRQSTGSLPAPRLTPNDENDSGDEEIDSVDTSSRSDVLELPRSLAPKLRQAYPTGITTKRGANRSETTPSTTQDSTSGLVDVRHSALNVASPKKQRIEPWLLEAYNRHLPFLSKRDNRGVPEIYSVLETFWVPQKSNFFMLFAPKVGTSSRIPSHASGSRRSQGFETTIVLKNPVFCFWDPVCLVPGGMGCLERGCSGMLQRVEADGRLGPCLRKVTLKGMGQQDGEERVACYWIIGKRYYCSLKGKCPRARVVDSCDEKLLDRLPGVLRSEYPVEEGDMLEELVIGEKVGANESDAMVVDELSTSAAVASVQEPEPEPEAEPAPAQERAPSPVPVSASAPAQPPIQEPASTSTPVPAAAPVQAPIQKATSTQTATQASSPMPVPVTAPCAGPERIATSVARAEVAPVLPSARVPENAQATPATVPASAPVPVSEPVASSVPAVQEHSTRQAVNGPVVTNNGRTVRFNPNATLLEGERGPPSTIATPSSIAKSILDHVTRSKASFSPAGDKTNVPTPAPVPSPAPAPTSTPPAAQQSEPPFLSGLIAKAALAKVVARNANSSATSAPSNTANVENQREAAARIHRAIVVSPVPDAPPPGTPVPVAFQAAITDSQVLPVAGDTGENNPPAQQPPANPANEQASTSMPYVHTNPYAYHGYYSQGYGAGTVAYGEGLPKSFWSYAANESDSNNNPINANPTHPLPTNINPLPTQPASPIPAPTSQLQPRHAVPVASTAAAPGTASTLTNATIPNPPVSNPAQVQAIPSAAPARATATPVVTSTPNPPAPTTFRWQPTSSTVTATASVTPLVANAVASDSPAFKSPQAPATSSTAISATSTKWMTPVVLIPNIPAPNPPQPQATTSASTPSPVINSNTITDKGKKRGLPTEFEKSPPSRRPPAPKAKESPTKSSTKAAKNLSEQTSSSSITTRARKYAAPPAVPKPKPPRVCAKCRSPECRGKKNQKLCTQKSVNRSNGAGDNAQGSSRGVEASCFVFPY
ncbi:hypothetical protein FRC03_007168 [Tulasnella sp. 419]|nr:hypothetical protein FRC03_007168 [Tulasnella sp. 419]